MRTDDLTPPTIAPHPIPPDAPIARWDAVLRIGIVRDPGVAQQWDTGDVWDDNGPRAVWDAADDPTDWVDAVCDFHALRIAHGQPDELGLYPASVLTLSLDNRSGAYSSWTTAGRQAAWQVGNPVAVWSEYRGDVRWLFAGRIATWRQAGDMIEATAFDAFARLAADAGAEWTAGAAGQLPRARMNAIAAHAGVNAAVIGDDGSTVLAVPAALAADVSPLEAMQVAALSDGGVVYGEPDGQLTYRDRYWRNGRADQPRVWSFTDNACDSSALATWDAVAGADDDGLVSQVVLVNLDGQVATATLDADAGNRLTHPLPDWWTGDAGATLAQFLLAVASTAGYRVEQFAVHASHPAGDWWDAALDVRRGDRLNWITDTMTPDGPARLDLDLVALAVTHDVTPDDWLTTVACSRAVGTRAELLWDTVAVLWDDPNPAAVWRT